MIGKRRHRHEIIAEILGISKDGALKTQIMYKARLSFRQLEKYLEQVLSANLVEVTRGNPHEVYKTTKKGRDYMKNFNEIIGMLSDDNNGPQLRVDTSFHKKILY